MFLLTNHPYAHLNTLYINIIQKPISLNKRSEHLKPLIIQADGIISNSKNRMKTQFSSFRIIKSQRDE